LKWIPVLLILGAALYGIWHITSPPKPVDVEAPMDVQLVWYTRENASLYGFELSNATTKIGVNWYTPHIEKMPGGSLLEGLWFIGYVPILSGLIKLARQVKEDEQKIVDH
jgi:hypothetical protein